MDSNTRSFQPADETLINFGGSDDLRYQRPTRAVMNNILMGEFPSLFMDQTGTIPTDHRNMNGLNVMLVLLRHFYMHLKTEFADEIAEHEPKNPILRLAWCVLDDSIRSQRFQNAARTEIWSWLQKLQIPPRLAFWDLAESDIMLDTIFKTDQFLLYRPRVLCLTEGDTKWKATWYEPRENAEDSCIDWDGREDLGTFISNKFGVFLDSDNKKKYLYTSNKPAFLRVRYDNTNEELLSFRHIAEIRVDGKNRYQHWDEDLSHSESDRIRVRYYRLISAVRLREETERDARDVIRRWDLSGKHLPDPTNSTFSDDKWKFGEKPWQYRLYYCILPVGYEPPVKARCPSLPEVALKHGNWLKNVKLDDSVMEQVRADKAKERSS